jgi:hypothetical protein
MPAPSDGDCPADPFNRVRVRIEDDRIEAQRLQATQRQGGIPLVVQAVEEIELRIGNGQLLDIARNEVRNKRADAIGVGAIGQ